MELTLGMVELSHTPRDNSWSRISHANIDGFDCFSDRIFCTTYGVATCNINTLHSLESTTTISGFSGIPGFREPSNDHIYFVFTNKIICNICALFQYLVDWLSILEYCRCDAKSQFVPVVWANAGKPFAQPQIVLKVVTDDVPKWGRHMCS